MLVKTKKRWHPLLEPIFEGGKMTRKMTMTILMMKLLLAVVDGIVVLGTDFHAGYDALLGIPENRPSSATVFLAFKINSVLSFSFANLLTIFFKNYELI